MTPILRFYAGAGTDGSGRTLAEIQRWDDARLEAVHDYIQWLFPLPEASGFNPGAPLLSAADINAFKADPALLDAVRASLARMRAFYHLSSGRLPGGGGWLTPGNHNMLRLSRILRCLHLLGLDPEAAAPLGELEALYEGGAGRVIGPVTLGYWRRAAA